MQLAAALIALAVAGVRLFGKRRDPWLTGAIALTGAALLLGWPPFMDAVADGPGVIRLRLAQHAAALAAVAAMAVFADKRRTNKFVTGWAIGLAAAIGVLIWSAERVIDVRPLDVDPSDLLGPAHVDVPGVAVYLVVFTGYLALCLAYVGEGCLRRRRESTGIARLGLLLIAIGCGLGVGYALQRVIDVIGPSIGGPITAFALTIGGILTAVVGSLILAIGRRSG